MKILQRAALSMLLLVLVATLAAAQGWRGMGRAAGKVTDEEGKPLADVVIKLTLPGAGGTEVKTNNKGEWAIGGIARGDWNVDFEKAGYDVLRISVSISEYSRIPPVETKLKKSAPDPNELIKADLTKASRPARREESSPRPAPSTKPCSRNASGAQIEAVDRQDLLRREAVRQGDRAPQGRGREEPGQR
jgi:hypothetical protein